MVHQKSYYIDSLDSKLYSDVLVKCKKCGDKDILKNNNTIEPLQNVRNISDYEECELCNSNNWIKVGELITISKLYPNDKNRYNLTDCIDKNKKIIEYYKKAEQLDFYILNVDENQVKLYKKHTN